MNNKRLNPLLKEFPAEDVDLAQQLLGLNRQPGKALQRRVQSIPTKSFWTYRGRNFRLVWGGVALLLVVMLFNSPTAKATLWKLEKVVGQIQLTVMQTKPTYTEPVAAKSVSMSLAEVRSAVPFSFAVPTYIPGGLSTNYETSIVKLDVPLVKMLWRNTENNFVQLTAHPYNGQISLAQTLVGPESSDTILINGQPAVIIYGAWDESSQTWGYQEQITTLIWNVDNIQYRLLAFGNTIPFTELMAMAESVR